MADLLDHLDQKEIEQKIKRIESAYCLSDSPLQRQKILLILDELKLELNKREINDKPI